MFKQGFARNQVAIFDLAEMVAEDSPARQIDEFVSRMDTSYFAKATPKAVGRRPYDPKDLLKLYIYGCDREVYSSRKLEREAKINIEVMWLLNGLQPDDWTICAFRRENAENIARFFNEFVVALKNAKYIDGKLVGIDGTKIRANNSKRNNYSLKKLDRLIDRIDGKAIQYLQKLENGDKITQDEVKQQEARLARKAEYECYKKRIKDGEVAEVSTTDPDSRIMLHGDNGTNPSFNVQGAVDSKNKLLTGLLVVNEPNDQGQLHKVAKATKENLELDEITVVADKGYFKTEDLKDCHEDKIETIVSPPDDPKTDVFSKAEHFTFDKENDCYTCPNNQILTFSVEEKNGSRKYRNPKACKNCPLKLQCTKSTYRTVSRHKHDAAAEKNNKTFLEKYDLYQQRQLLCEHPFGTIKRTMAVRQFLTRGLKNVTAEAAIIFTCYNLKRLRNIKQYEDKNTTPPALILPIIRKILLFQLFIIQNTQHFTKLQFQHKFSR